MRADAKIHRQRLIAAASHVFATRGHGAPLKDVLDESGLGRGTLYRHFPDREALMSAVIEYEVDAALEDVRQRAGDPTLLRDFLAEQSRASSVHIPALQQFGAQTLSDFIIQVGPKFHLVLQSVLDTARANGQLREGFGIDDLKLVLEMLSTARTSCALPGHDCFDRAASFLLDGICREHGPCEHTPTFT